jgi:hypothetical protein
MTEKKKLVEQGEQIIKKKRGSKSASVEANCTATKQEIREILQNNLYWYKRDIVKSDEECAERLNEYFQRIVETGEIPTVEKMCLALGTVRSVVWGWEQGNLGSVRQNMIKKAKEISAALDAELVSKGKIPQITYIFRAKNFFGMVDKQEYVLTPNNPLGDFLILSSLFQVLILYHSYFCFFKNLCSSRIFSYTEKSYLSLYAYFTRLSLYFQQRNRYVILQF